jgi:NitT/TauT family transport system substrate-binding protein
MSKIQADVADPPGYCEPGFPKPQPLPTKTTIKWSISDPKLETIALTILGVPLGEYAKENLDVQLVSLPSADAVQALSQGQIDALIMGANAGPLNAKLQGFDDRMVLGSLRFPENATAGIWAQKDITPQNITQIAGQSGPGSVGYIGLYQALKKVGRSLKEVQSVQLPSGQDLLTAMQNGAVQAAVMNSPYQQQLAKEPDKYHMIAPSVPFDQAALQVFFGPSMNSTNRAVGEAFTRAYLRTINTYLAPSSVPGGDWKKDPARLQLIANATKIPADQLAADITYVPDYELQCGAMKDILQMYVDQGILQASQTTDPEQFNDRSYVEAVIGDKYPKC